MSLLLLFGAAPAGPGVASTTLAHLGLSGSDVPTINRLSTTTAHVAFSGSDVPTISRPSTTLATLAVESLAAWTRGASLPAPASPEVIWVHDLAGDRVMAIANPIGLEVEDRWQSIEQLRFAIPADDAKAGYLGEDRDVEYDGRRYVIRRIEQVRDGARALVAVECDATWIRLADNIQVGNFVLTESSVAAGASQILDGSGWTFVEPDPADATTYSISAADESSLSLIRNWAKVAGYEIQFNTQTSEVAFLAQQGSSRGIGFRYGRNLKTIKRTVEPPKATRLYPFGKNNLSVASVNGDDYVEDFTYYTGKGLSLAAARASYTRSMVWVDDSFTDAVALLAAANAKLDDLAQPRTIYECSVVDLSSLTGLPEDEFMIGDTVRVRDSVLDFDVATRVVRLIKRPLEPWRNEIELSASPESLVDALREPSTRGSDYRDWVLFKDDSVVSTTVAATQRILNVIELIFDPDGEAVLGYNCEGTASGTGTIEFTQYDEDAAAVLGPVSRVEFTDGDPVRCPVTYAEQGLEDRFIFSVRAQIVSGSGTVAFAADKSRFWILAKGARLGIAEPTTNTETFNAGACTDWEVPAGVRRIFVDMAGGGGGPTGYRAGGGRVRARIDVTPGDTVRICVGGAGENAGGFNGGGTPESGGGYGGGGATHLAIGTFSLAERILVAGGGGGWGGLGGGVGSAGGGGGYPAGAAGTNGSGGQLGGGGGTQSAGGTSPVFPGGEGTFGVGGSQVLGGGGRGGGGGGGWYGGGAGWPGGSSTSGGGGGGSSYADGDGVLLLIHETGVHLDNGYCFISY